MSDSCLLETEGYSVLIEFLELLPRAQAIRINTTLALKPHLGEVSFTVPSVILATDVEKLFAFFEQHMKVLAVDYQHRSFPLDDSALEMKRRVTKYIDLDLHFDIQALSGEIRADNDGDFALLFLINVGRAQSESTYCYFGGRSVISVQQVYAFLNAGRAILAKYNA